MARPKSVAILGPGCGGISESVEVSFKLLGWRTEVHAFGEHAGRLVNRALAHVAPAIGRNAITKSFNDALRGRILGRDRAQGLGLLVVLKGDALDDASEAALRRSGTPTVLWMYDSANRCPWHRQLASVAEHVYYVDAADAERFGARASWLPLGFDDRVYGPRADGVRDIDVLLVGTVGRLYSRRMRFLRLLARSGLARERRCAFIGSTGEVVSNGRLMVELARGGVSWISRRLPPRALADHIARAKVCVNIHQDDGAAPINPLFFAIPGCGTCQVAEEGEHLRHWLRPSAEYVEADERSLVEVLERLLKDDAYRESVATRGRETCREHHTMTQRVRAIAERSWQHGSGRPPARGGGPADP
jgi:hypothetical protein